MIKKFKQMNDILLHLLDELPDKEAQALREELKVLYSALIKQMEAAQLTNDSYEIIAGKIRAKASVHKRKLASRMKQELALEAAN